MPTFDDSSSDQSSVRYVITLVHGTWARSAPWVRPRSALSKALRERFGKEQAKIFRFVWTGGNSHRARRQASEKLRRRLAGRLNHHPRARHYLICHSHGGNVALNALAGSGLEHRITGVACLATPFLVARKRDLGPRPWKHLAGALVVVMLLTMWALDKLLLPLTWPAVVRFAAIVLVAALVMGALTVLIPKWRVYADRLCRELSTPALKQSALLIIRSPADEASGALAVFQLISQLTVRLYVATFELYERLELAAHRWSEQKRKMIVIAGGSFMVSVGAIFLFAGLPLESTLGDWAVPFIIGTTFAPMLVTLAALLLAIGRTGEVTVVVRLLASALVWPVVGMLSLALLPFGREMALANMLLDVTAETTPAGSWTVHLIEPPASEEIGTNVLPLMHSIVYENPRVLRLLCDWIGAENGSAPPDRTLTGSETR